MNELGKCRVVLLIETIIIIVLIIVIITLSVNNNTCNKKLENALNKPTQSENDYITDEEDIGTPPTLTDEEAINTLKTNYNDAIRYILNEDITYCGTLAAEGKTTLDINGYTYQKSDSFNTYEDLEKYIKQYATNNFLEKADFNHQTKVNGQNIKSYYESGGHLYCNTWKKDKNLLLVNYAEAESSFEIIRNNKNSFKIKATVVYYNNDQTIKTPIEYEFKVVNQKNSWLLDDYKKLS